MATTTAFDRTRLSRAPRVRSLQLGDLTITYVPDGVVRLKPRGWLPAATAADWAAYRDHLDDDGYLVAGIGGLLVERGDRALLIDTGFGPESHPDDPANPLLGKLYGGQLLDNLRRLGPYAGADRGRRHHPPALRPPRLDLEHGARRGRTTLRPRRASRRGS
ncbi:hypothetical protein ACIBIZ_39125 [Nonomuraea spiralis]|uniref:hypothetical protein n=1 Tax=Nonomuraea spiralis TaxID=46182 RepID=UPI0037A28916